MMLAIPPVVNSVGLIILTAVLSFGGAKYWAGKKAAAEKSEKAEVKAEKVAENLAEDHEELVNRVRELEGQLKAVGQTIMPLNAAYQQMLVKQLTHFHTPRGDALLAKLEPFVITPEEETELFAILKEREITLNGQIDDSERDAAHMLPLVMKRVRLEAVNMADEAMGVAFKTVAEVVEPKEPEA